MAQVLSQEPIQGFEAPVHRALTEPILLAGAPRAVAILNGTVSAAIGLGLRLWIAACCGHSATWPQSGPPGETRCSSKWCAGTCGTRPISVREVT
jgi:hypothetical protein